MIMSPARVWREKGIRLRLEGSKCRKCEKIFYPPKPACPYCGFREVEKIQLPRKGKIISWVIENTVPEGYRAEAPIILALIELENGVKIISTLTDVDVHSIYEGMEVEATLRKLWSEGEEGLIIYGIKFTPVRNQK